MERLTFSVKFTAKDFSPYIIAKSDFTHDYGYNVYTIYNNMPHSITPEHLVHHSCLNVKENVSELEHSVMFRCPCTNMRLNEESKALIKEKLNKLSGINVLSIEVEEQDWDSIITDLEENEKCNNQFIFCIDDFCKQYPLLYQLIGVISDFQKPSYIVNNTLEIKQVISQQERC